MAKKPKDAEFEAKEKPAERKPIMDLSFGPGGSSDQAPKGPGDTN